MSAFTYNDQETGEIIETDDPLVFWAALREQAEAQVQRWHDHRIEALLARGIAQNLKADREFAESALRLDSVLDGKNAEDRKAQLDTILRGDQHWNDIVMGQRDMDEEYGRAEAAADAAHARYRVTLRDLEVLAAWLTPREEPRSAE